MDLWDTASVFLCSKINGDLFLLSDLIGLSYKWGIALRSKPSGGIGGNGKNQVTIVFRDLLEDLRAARPDLTAHNLISMLTEVKKFSPLSQQLREVLFREALIFVERSGAAMADQKREIASLQRIVKTYQDVSTKTPPKQSMRRQRSGFFGRDEGSPPEQPKDWKDAFSRSQSQLHEQRKSIGKLSKLCLGALNAVDRLESHLSQNPLEMKRNETMNELKSELENHFHSHREEILSRCNQAIEEAAKDLNSMFSKYFQLVPKATTNLLYLL